jgi:hypothetical protein
MKKLNYIMILALAVPLFLQSCLKEDNVIDPVVSGTEFYMTDITGKDSLITEIFSGNKIKIVVLSNADIVSVWPGGERTIMKMKNSTTDSVDMYNHPVLVKSNCFSDYGLVKAQGLTTSLTDDGGWYAFYTYPTAGAFDLTIVATNHGYDGPDLRRVIHEAGKITVN